ncbi:MAG: hypothetical protein FJ150_03540 [Euryarchaeota archaeon]|nr:hypothetical protein [Euryarchaeota archaeon]
MILGIIFGAIILLVVYFAFFYAPTANFEILDSNLKMVSNSSSRDISATTINGTIQNTGSSTINIVCVDVYSGNNYVGKFFLTDLKPNDNV